MRYAERVDERLVFEIDIPKGKLPEIAKVMVWTDEDDSDFTAGMGGWDLTSHQVRAIEKILDKNFFPGRFGFSNIRWENLK